MAAFNSVWLSMVARGCGVGSEHSLRCIAERHLLQLRPVTRSGLESVDVGVPRALVAASVGVIESNEERLFFSGCLGDGDAAGIEGFRVWVRAS